MHWPVAPKSLSWWGKVDISLIVQQAHCYFCQVLYLAQNGQRYFTLKLSFNEFIFFSVKSCWFHYCVFKLKTLRSLVKGKRDWAKSLYIVLYKERGAYLILCTVYKMCIFEILKKIPAPCSEIYSVSPSSFSVALTSTLLLLSGSLSGTKLLWTLSSARCTSAGNQSEIESQLDYVI
jgi:hypothetical protein